MSKQELIRKRERYNSDPQYRQHVIEQSRTRYNLKKAEIYQKQKLYLQLNKIKINEKRKERYWKDQEHRKKKLEYLKERRQRIKNKGYTKEESIHIEHFLLGDELKTRSLVYTRAYRAYQRNNKYGNSVPVSSFR